MLFNNGECMFRCLTEKYMLLRIFVLAFNDYSLNIVVSRPCKQIEHCALGDMIMCFHFDVFAQNISVLFYINYYLLSLSSIVINNILNNQKNGYLMCFRG